MIIVFTIPLVVGLVIWAVIALGKQGAAKPPPMIQRTVTAPDGRRMTFTVPANEPASVTIARMYPEGGGPPPPPPGQDFVNPAGRQ
jgi:hypothetical protein